MTRLLGAVELRHFVHMPVRDGGLVQMMYGRCELDTSGSVVYGAAKVGRVPALWSLVEMLDLRIAEAQRAREQVFALLEGDGA